MIFFIIESSPPPPPPSGLPLDSYTTGMAIACSFTVLVSSYLGSPLLRVRRDSDNAELDIGADSSGNIDAATLVTFVGSGSGYVTKWYDQSGNARHIVQATASKQPKIVDSGLYLNELHFDGVDDYMHAPMVGANALSFMTNYDFWRTQDANTIIGCDDAFLNGSGNNATVLHYESTPNAIEAYTTTNGFASYSQLSDATHLNDTVEHQVGYIADRGVTPVMTLWDNGTQVQSSQTNVAEPGDFGDYELRLGAISSTVVTSAINYRNFVAYTGNRTATMPAVSTALKTSTDAIGSPTPNIVDKAWSGLLTVNFDGFKDTLYPAGNKPAGRVTSPTLVGLSLKAGSFVNGENGQGFPLSVFGYSLGTPTGLGTSSGTQFWFRDPLGDNLWHQASTYRYMKSSKVYAALELMELCIQPGNAAGFTAGHALDVSVTVNGVRTNVLVGAYVSQPGHVYFCSPAGNDGTGVVDDVTHPYRYAQFFNTGSGTYTGIWAILKPGDMICMRGNAGTWTDQVGQDSRFLAFPRPAVPPFAGTGTVPTGAAGHGYITIMGYPGEDVHCSFTGGGGIQGCDSARAQAGWGQYVQVTNLRIDIGAGSDRDGAPINLQNGADHWVVTNNDCGPWVAGSSAFLNSSAIGGQGSNCYIAFNKCHDIEGLSDLQNHGMYFGGVSGGTGYDNASFNMEVCYNWVFNVTQGSGIQFYWQGGNSKYMYGNLVHHNVIHDVRKYCLNVGESTTGLLAWDNVCWNSGWSIIRFAAPSVSGIDIRVEYNTFDAWDTVNSEGTPSAAVLMDGNIDIADGTIKFNHNIVRMRQGRTGTGLTQYWYTLNAGIDSGLTASQNVYFDPMGQTTAGWAIDAQAIYGDPKFNNPLAGGDYSLQSGSPALAAATVADIISGVTTDVYGITRPGSSKTIGATEGVLT